MGVKEDNFNLEEQERVILVGVDLEEEDFEYSMEELKQLAEACNMMVVGFCVQKMEHINKAHYIGTGKIQEIKEFSIKQGANLIIFYHSLTPSQLRNLQKMIDIPVMDRTSLILDIFSRRARTREAKLQVETARLQYLHSRLIGMHDALTRQGGTSGSMSSRGSGEKKLELDRRRIEHRLTECNRELEKIKRERETQRKKRIQSSIPKVSLVGYTNAGKSTIMNRLVEMYLGEAEKKVFEENMLFATLDTSVRHIVMENQQELLVTDTVGFIHNLPHTLVKAFRSTLEEILTADLILQIIDYSDPHYKQHMDTTRITLQELGALEIPVFNVYNKIDLLKPEELEILSKNNEQSIFISAKETDDIKNLLNKIVTILYKDYQNSLFLIPYSNGGIASEIKHQGINVKIDYQPEGMKLTGRFHEKEIEKYRKYKISIKDN